MEQFGRNLRYYRKQRRLTQTELAERAGVAPAYISQIESALRMPSLKVARRFADTLKVDLPVLLGVDDGARATDRMMDSDKIETLRSLIRSVEFDQEHRPGVVDVESYAGSEGIVISQNESCAVRVYSFSENAKTTHREMLHSHPGHERIYCAAGGVRLVVDGREELVAPGEVRTIDASMPHALFGDFGAVVVSTVTPPVTVGTHREWPFQANGKNSD
jgi:XRE family transcriptional regulator of biofilm formation